MHHLISLVYTGFSSDPLLFEPIIFLMALHVDYVLFHFSGLDLLPSRFFEWGWNQSWFVRSLSSTQQIWSRSNSFSCFNLVFPLVLLQRCHPVQDLCPEWSVLLVFKACVLILFCAFHYGRYRKSLVWLWWHLRFVSYLRSSSKSTCKLFFNF